MAVKSEGEVMRGGVEETETKAIPSVRGVPSAGYTNISQLGAMIFLGEFKRAKAPLAFENISAFRTGVVSVGLGYGFHLYNNGWVVPGYLHLSVAFFAEGFSPLIHIDGGYSYGRASRSGTDFSGLIVGGGLGFRIPVSERSAWVINASYRLQRSNKDVDLLTFSGVQPSTKLDYRLIVVTTGFSF
jgi:hypothetical protein